LIIAKKNNPASIHYDQTVVSSKPSFEKTKTKISIVMRCTCFYSIKIK